MTRFQFDKSNQKKKALFVLITRICTEITPIVLFTNNCTIIDIELELDHPTRICTKITLIVKFTHHSYDNRILNLILIQVGRVETWIAARSVASPVGGVVSEAVALL